MLWLSSEGVDGRVLIDKQDGYEVWVQPHQLQLGSPSRGSTPMEGNGVSAETMSGTRDDEELSRLSREFELAASPWIGLHYKYEEN